MAAIDGLSSGLDTTSIIKQLMQLERQPQVRLQTRQSATESAILSQAGTAMLAQANQAPQGVLSLLR